MWPRWKVPPADRNAPTPCDSARARSPPPATPTSPATRRNRRADWPRTPPWGPASRATAWASAGLRPAPTAPPPAGPKRKGAAAPGNARSPHWQPLRPLPNLPRRPPPAAAARRTAAPPADIPGARPARRLLPAPTSDETARKSLPTATPRRTRAGPRARRRTDRAPGRRDREYIPRCGCANRYRHRPAAPANNKADRKALPAAARRADREEWAPAAAFVPPRAQPKVKLPLP